MKKVVIASAGTKDAVIDAIKKAVCTGTKGDGKVFVTEITDALDICTKKRGTMDI